MLPELILYIVIMVAYVVIKPPISYNTDGTLKSFGTKPGQTLYPLWVIAILTSILSFFICTYLN